MKVSELAEKAGTTATTIRFYEAEGILPAPPRQPNGYRTYDATDLAGRGSWSRSATSGWS
jgi:DNA-binding transcriptional MerR regulator